MGNSASYYFYKGGIYTAIDRGANLPKLSDFQTWWSREIVFSDAGFRLTRARLVYALRHRDGGGHIGGLTDKSYVQFKTVGGGWTTQECMIKGSSPNEIYEPIGAPKPMSNVVGATMRQIGWELTETLKSLGEIT